MAIIKLVLGCAGAAGALVALVLLGSVAQGPAAPGPQHQRAWAGVAASPWRSRARSSAKCTYS
jgi:hypothetical protein